MDRGRNAKVKGDFSSAYKLAGSTIDKKTLRLHRRSIEQKELRLDAHNKRRNLVDLSPVQEGDSLLTQNKSYKGKTPIKGKDAAGKASKGLDRLEQLKKWKEEKELKRKLESKASNKKTPVFRVGKALEHGDQKLFVKSAAVVKHPNREPHITAAVKAAQISATSTVPKHTQAAGAHTTRSKLETRGRDTTSSRSKTEPPASSSRTKPAPSKTNMAAEPLQSSRSISRGASKQEAPKSAKKTGVPAAQSLHSATSATGRAIHGSKLTAPEVTTRVTRQSAKNKGMDEKQKNKSKTGTVSTKKFVSPTLELITKNVSTCRGGNNESFAPSEFVFNASSFVFKPLSPASAANFLFPNQDMSCTSFLETKPKRSSTPNREECAARSSQDVDMVTDTCNNTLRLERTTIPVTDATQLDSTSKPSADDTVVNSTSMNTSAGSIRRSVRKSSQSLESATSDDLSATIAVETDDGLNSDQSKKLDSEQTNKSAEKLRKTQARRSLRRSVLSSEETNSEVDENPVNQSSSRRNSQKLVMSTTVIENKNSGDTPSNKTTNPRRSLRRSLLTSSESDNTETSGDDLSSPKKQRRSSVQTSATVNVEPCVETFETETPTGQSRRKCRRSVAVAPEAEDICEVPETMDDTTETETPSRQSRRKSRRSVAVTPAAEVICEVPETVVDTTETETPSRRSVAVTPAAEVICEVPETVVDTTETETPSKRKSRRSVAVTPAAEVICEVPETVNEVEVDPVFEDKQILEVQSENSPSPTTPNTPSRQTQQILSEKSLSPQSSKSSDSGIDLTIPDREKTTPRGRQKRNRSFGGFRLPDANSNVLSAKRNSRKSVMPKSPEEWVNLLKHSPMVEMSRRTPKIGNVSMPVLNFDDVDLDDPNTSLQYIETSDELMETDEAMASMSTSQAMDDAAEAVDKQVSSPQDSMETVQVGEVSSTQDGPLSDECSSDEHDVHYFRNLLVKETRRLKDVSDHWDKINATTKLTEEIRGQIRTTVGQALLLMDQRFKQFLSLVDNCEFGLGEKETTSTDLQGFWDMIYFQVEDVDAKFNDLSKLQANNWIDDAPKPVVKKIIKKKLNKPVTTKPVVKSKFASFRAQMKKQTEEPSSPHMKEEKVFEAPGFFRVASPIRTPKPHCEAGSTPTKATSASSAKASLSVSSCDELHLNRTPARKSYLPAVPSPLLQDTTPVPRPKRTSSMKTPIPKRLLAEMVPEVVSQSSEDISEVEESSSKRFKKTTVRRSLRPRRSVNFSDELPTVVGGSPIVTGTDEDFARLLQPIAEPQETVDVTNDSFSKYLQPMTALDTSVEKENSAKPTRRRRSSLKECRSTERRRSRSRSVHFISPVMEDLSHVKMPHTPFNKDSLVKQGRITRRSVSEADNDDVFKIENVDNDENSPRSTFRQPRPSLLFTPPKMKRSPVVARNVPTATLISFSP